MKLKCSNSTEQTIKCLVKSATFALSGSSNLSSARKSLGALAVASLTFLTACDGDDSALGFDNASVSSSAEGIDASAQSSLATDLPNGVSASSNCAASSEDELAQALTRLVEARQLWQSQGTTSYQYSLDIASDEFPPVDTLTGAIVTVDGNLFQDIVYPSDGNFSSVPAYTVEEWFSFIESRISHYSGVFAYSVAFDEDLGFPSGFTRKLPCGYDGDRRYQIQFVSTGSAT